MYAFFQVFDITNVSISPVYLKSLSWIYSPIHFYHCLLETQRQVNSNRIRLLKENAGSQIWGGEWIFRVNTWLAGVCSSFIFLFVYKFHLLKDATFLLLVSSILLFNHVGFFVLLAFFCLLVCFLSVYLWPNSSVHQTVAQTRWKVQSPKTHSREQTVALQYLVFP